MSVETLNHSPNRDPQAEFISAVRSLESTADLAARGEGAQSPVSQRTIEGQPQTLRSKELPAIDHAYYPREDRSASLHVTHEHDSRHAHGDMEVRYASPKGKFELTADAIKGVNVRRVGRDGEAIERPATTRDVKIAERLARTAAGVEGPTSNH